MRDPTAGSTTPQHQHVVGVGGRFFLAAICLAGIRHLFEPLRMNRMHAVGVAVVVAAAGDGPHPCFLLRSACR